MKPLNRVLMLALIVVVLAGCAAEEVPTPVATSAPSTEGGDPPEAATQADSTAEPPSVGPGDFMLTDPAAGLDQRDSYRAVLTLAFDGTNGGQADQWTRTYDQLVTADPPARQVILTVTGSAAEDAPEERTLTEIDGMVYESTEAGCVVSVGDANGLARYEPASMLPAVIGAEEAGSEDVGGAATTHYTFDQRALGEEGLAESTGDVWVAAEGYVVKYSLTTQGGAEYFGEGIEGTLTFEYELAPADPSAVIAIPPGCPAGLIDAPTMPDAESVEQLPGMTSFTTPSDLAAVMAFYQTELAALGWTLLSPPDMTETLGAAAFTMGDQQLSVIAIPAEEGTRVRLVIGRAP